MEDRMPYGQLVLFTICNIANGLSISVLPTQSMYPYASNMVMDFGLTKSRSSTGYYAGFLCGGVMIGRGLGAPVWGWAADRYGRKPVLIVSLLSIIAGSLSFGFSRSFLWATFSLFIAGMFCTLAVVCKTCVSEVTPNSLQPRAMSYYTLGWYYGQIAGYSIGGLLVHPEKTGLVSGGILVDYPYLLPNLVCAVIATIALIGVIFCFKETLGKVSHKSKSPSQSSDGTQSPQGFSLLRSNNILRIIAMHSNHVLCTTGFVELYPLWCWSSKDKGGLNFDPQDIGTTLTLCCVCLVIVQGLMYGNLVKRMGLLGVIKASSLILVPILIGFPFISVMSQRESVLKGLLILGCLSYYLLGFTIFTSIAVLTNNSVQQQDRGKVNGCEMSIGYFINGVTPLCVGYLFAYTSQHGEFFPLDYHFAFVMLGCGMAFEALMAMSLPQKLEKPLEEEYQSVLKVEAANNEPSEVPTK